MKILPRKLGELLTNMEKRAWPLASLFVCALLLMGASAASVSTYEVIYGHSTKTVYSYVESEKQVLELAGYDADKFAVIDKDEDDNTSKLYISRLFDVTIKADGEEKTARVTAGQTREILKSAGISLAGDDEVYPSENTILTADTVVTVVRVQKDLIETTETIPFDTVKRMSEALVKDEIVTKQEGQNGEKRTVTEVVKRDGVEVSRTVVSQETLKQAQTCIIEYGTTGGKITARNGDIVRYKKVLDVSATAYSTEGWSNNITASGTVARVGAIAVDPKVIPLGSRLYITSADGKSWVYGYAVAEDTGGSIKGNKIDLFFNTRAECRKFGIRKAKVYVL